MNGSGIEKHPSTAHTLAFIKDTSTWSVPNTHTALFPSSACFIRNLSLPSAASYLVLLHESGIGIDEEFMPFIAAGNDFDPDAENAADNWFLGLTTCAISAAV